MVRLIVNRKMELDFYLIVHQQDRNLVPIFFMLKFAILFTNFNVDKC